MTIALDSEESTVAPRAIAADTALAPRGSPAGRVGAGAHRGPLTRDPADALARVVIAGLFLGLAYRIGIDVLETGRLTGVLLLASELLVVVLTLARRDASLVDRRPPARVVAAVSILGPFLLRPGETAVLLAEPITVALSAVGLVLVVAGKMSLGRSFGLLPANRGIVGRGAYRLVRHPIYLGYLVTHAAFLCANASLWNATALGIADVALMVRARLEERVLARDAAYRRYRRRVRWRLVPGVF